MWVKHKSEKIKMNVFYNKEERKTKIGNMKSDKYNFKLYGNDWKRYYTVRFNWNELMPMMFEWYIARYWMEEWKQRFEEFMEVLRWVQKKWFNPFWLFISKYNRDFKYNIVKK